MNSSDEIKSKLDIVEVIREYIQLKAVGINFRAICPFHHEKSPSFTVSPEKQIWHCFGCFPPGQKIKTPFGYHNIETLNKKHFVISGSGLIRKILAIHKRNYIGDVVDINIRKLSGTVSLTADHNVFAIRPTAPYLQKETKNFYRRYRKYLDYFQAEPYKYFKKVKRYFPFIEIPASEIKKNDFLLYPINTRIHDIENLNLKDYLKKIYTFGPRPLKIPYCVKINNDFLKLIGYYIAEGSNHRAYIRFSLGNHEEKLATEIISLIKNIFGIEAKIHRRSGKKTGIEITACHAYLADIFANLCGKGAENKHIPFVFLDLPFSKQKTLVDAAWKGDGTSFIANKSIRQHKSVTTISRILAEQIIDVLLRNNFFPSFYISQEKKDKKGVHHKEAYHVFWSEQAVSQHNLVYYKEDGTKYWLLPVKEVNKRNYSGPVHNLTVEEDHSYVATNFAVANCGKGGDVFSFIMEMEGISFIEALRMLAVKAGVTLKKVDPAITSQRNRLLDVAELACKYFHKVLTDSPAAESARLYLKNRCLTEETISNWRIGYSPDGWENLINFLKSKGFNENEIFLAGLSVKKEHSQGFIDRFRGRIMFPLSDVNGSVVGFSARVMPDKEALEKLGKYINTPSTMIYDKSKILFGLDKAKMSIKKEDVAVLVEGQMDAITAHQAGFTNIIASSGTALTVDQVAIIKRYSANLFLAFDMDKAGDLAVERGIAQAMQAEMNIKVIEIPKGKDPDEFIKNKPDEWLNVVANAKPMMQYYFDKTFAKFNSNQYDDKHHAIKILLPVIAKLGSKIEQDYWLKQLSQITDIAEAVLKEALIELEKKIKNIVPTKTDKQPLSENQLVKQNREEMLSELLLALIIKQPTQIEYLENRIKPDEIVGDINQFIYRNLIIYYNKINEALIDQQEILAKEKEIDCGDFSNWLSEQQEEVVQSQMADCVNKLNRLVILADKDFYDYSAEQIKAETISIINVLKKNYLSARLKKITKLISQAEKNGVDSSDKEEKLKSLLEEFQVLAEEIKEI